MKSFSDRAAPSVTASSSNNGAKTFTNGALLLFEAVSDTALRPPREGIHTSAQMVRLAEILIADRNVKLHLSRPISTS